MVPRPRGTRLAAPVAPVAVLAALAVAARLCGVSLFAVQSASMEPALPVGSLVAVAPRAWCGAPFPGEVWAYLRSGSVVVHRVVSVDEATGSVVAKGDANEGPDPGPVAPDELLGRVFARIPGMGAALSSLGPARPLVAGALVALAAAHVVRVRPRRRKRPFVG